MIGEEAEGIDKGEGITKQRGTTIGGMTREDQEEGEMVGIRREVPRGGGTQNQKLQVDRPFRTRG